MTDRRQPFHRLRTDPSSIPSYHECLWWSEHGPTRERITCRLRVDLLLAAIGLPQLRTWTDTGNTILDRIATDLLPFSSGLSPGAPPVRPTRIRLGTEGNRRQQARLAASFFPARRRVVERRPCIRKVRCPSRSVPGRLPSFGSRLGTFGPETRLFRRVPSFAQPRILVIRETPTDSGSLALPTVSSWFDRSASAL